MTFVNQPPGYQISTGVGTRPTWARISGAFNTNSYVKKEALIAKIFPTNKLGTRGRGSVTNNEKNFHN